MREHERCWLRVHAPTIAGQTQTNAANARMPDPEAGGNGRTTSSLRDLRSRSLFARLRSRARGKAENANEARRVFLVVTIAHGERRQIGAIQRMLRLTAHHRHVALI